MKWIPTTTKHPDIGDLIICADVRGKIMAMGYVDEDDEGFIGVDALGLNDFYQWLKIPEPSKS